MSSTPIKRCRLFASCTFLAEDIDLQNLCSLAGAFNTPRPLNGRPEVLHYLPTYCILSPFDRLYQERGPFLGTKYSLS